MAEVTKNYNLEIQQGNDYVSIERINNNFKKIDEVIINKADLDKRGNINIPGQLRNTGGTFINFATYKPNTNYTVVNIRVWIKNGLCHVNCEVKVNEQQNTGNYTATLTGLPYAEVEMSSSHPSYDKPDGTALLAGVGPTGNLIMRLGSAGASYVVHFSYPCSI